MKKDKHLLVQIGVRISIFFLLMTLLLSAVIYIGGTSMFLAGKDEMLDRDLKRIKNEIVFFPEITEIFDIWYRYPDKVLGEFSPEDDKRLSAALAEKDDFTYRRFSQYTEEEKLYAAHLLYGTVSSWLDIEQNNFDYDKVYIMDISDERCGFIYCKGSNELYEANTSLGQQKNIDIAAHPAIRRILSGENRETEYEISDGEDGKSFYIGYMPLSYNGKTKYAICIEYDWSTFRKGFFENLILIVAAALLIMLIAGAMLMRYLKKTVTVPTTKIQRSVRSYIESHKSSDIIDELRTVDRNNELGILADDVTHLAVSLDDLISKLKESGSEMKKLTVQVMEALAHTIDAKDKYTNGHSERVAIYARMIAMNLGLPESEQDKIYYMGLLHDIGKIGIPNAIINKTTKLNDEEYELIRSHTIKGYEILKEIKSMPDLALAARWHHELYNGKGYPDGKAGEDIPFLIRIIAVADSYDAMTSNRSYRQYLPQEEVRAEIEKNIGIQFDPDVAKCMLKIIDADIKYSFHE